MIARLVGLAKYGITVVIGLLVDLSVGYGFTKLTGLPVIVGAVIGFLVAVATNYWLLERFVLKAGMLSWRRLGSTYLAAQGALAIRLVAVWTLDRLLPKGPDAALITLGVAAGISFVVNFGLLILLLNRPRRKRADERHELG